MRHAPTPPFDIVHSLQRSLESAGVQSTVGGSALRYARGLVDRVADWDVTTDADPEVVRAALEAAELPYERLAPTDALVSDALFRIDGGDHHIDLLCGFAVRDDRGVHRFRTEPAERWRGLSMKAPAPWARAYRLMGRTERAEMLERALTAEADA